MHTRLVYNKTLHVKPIQIWWNSRTSEGESTRNFLQFKLNRYTLQRLGGTETPEWMRTVSLSAWTHGIVNIWKCYQHCHQDGLVDILMISFKRGRCSSTPGQVNTLAWLSWWVQQLGGSHRTPNPQIAWDGQLGPRVAQASRMDKFDGPSTAWPVTIQYAHARSRRVRRPGGRRRACAYCSTSLTGLLPPGPCICTL